MTQIGFPKTKTVKLSQYEKMIARNIIVKNKHLVVKVKKVLRKKRVKLPSIRKLILKADKLFSVFIRQRDMRCVLCGATVNLTCGHLIKRGKKSVRWSEVNCHCLCMGCNWKDNFDHDVYVLWFIKNYGALPYQDLVEKSRGIFKPSRDYLLEIISKYDIKKT